MALFSLSDTPKSVFDYQNTMAQTAQTQSVADYNRAKLAAGQPALDAEATKANTQGQILQNQGTQQKFDDETEARKNAMLLAQVRYGVGSYLNQQNPQRLPAPQGVMTEGGAQRYLGQTPALGARYNPYSEENIQNFVDAALQKGVSPEVVKKEEDNLRAIAAKKAKELVDLQKDVATRNKTQEEARAEKRKNDAEAAHSALSQIRANPQDPESMNALGRATTEFFPGRVFKTQKDQVAALEELAKGSKTYQDQNELKDVPGLPGVKSNTRGEFYNANGSRMSDEEVKRRDLVGRNAGAARTNVTLAQESAFAKGVGEEDSKLATAAANKARVSQEAFGKYKDIHDAVSANPNGYYGPLAPFKALGTRLFPNDKKAAEETAALIAKNTLENASSNLELITAQANRGQGSFSDSERAIMRRAAAGDTNFTGPEWIAFSRASMKAEQLKQGSANKLIDEVQSRNQKTNIQSFKVQPMTSGIPEVDKAATPAQAAGAVPQTRVDTKAKYGF